jgi:hypothetical protein
VDGPAGDDDKTREDYIIVYPAAPALQPPPVVTPPSPPPVPPVPPGGPLPPGPPHGSNPAVPPVLPPAGGARPF